MANEWVAYATTHTGDYGGEIILEKWLKALASWMPPEDYARLLRRANNIAAKAAQEVIEFNKWKLEQIRLTNRKKE